MATIVLGAAETLKAQFQVKEVNSTNTVFKLFSKISFGLCIFASILVATSEYIGNPINCHLGKANVVSDDVFNAHCWIHGTNHVPEKYQEDFDCKAKQGAEENDLIFYQWVVFMLVINAILFKVPHTIWKIHEGGIMKSLFSGKKLKNKLLSEDDANENLDLDLYYYNRLKGQSNSYYFMFQLCQLLNFGMLALNWWVTDKFLGGNFSTYGADVIYYYSQFSSQFQRQNSDMVDPMCNAFPTKVGCSIVTVGPGGAGQKANGYCILSQNIINEKIYLFLWFWFLLMLVISVLQMIFEIAIFAIPGFRSFVIARQTGAFTTGEMKRYIERDCNYGDWFILHQIGKNTNKEFFYRFVETLSKSATSRLPKDNRESEKLLHSNENVTIPMEEMEDRKN